MGDTILGVYYRPPDSDKEVDEAFCGQLEVALRSQALALLWEFNNPGICGRHNMAQHTVQEVSADTGRQFANASDGGANEGRCAALQRSLPTPIILCSMNLHLCILRYQHSQTSLCTAAFSHSSAHLDLY